jgi:hypothetical protein
MSSVIASRFFIRSCGIPYDVVNLILAYAAPKQLVAAVDDRTETLVWKRNLMFYRELLDSTAMFRTQSWRLNGMVDDMGMFPFQCWILCDYQDDMHKHYCMYSTVMINGVKNLCYMYVWYRIPLLVESDYDMHVSLTRGTLYFPNGVGAVRQDEIGSFHLHNDTICVFSKGYAQVMDDEPWLDEDANGILNMDDAANMWD